MRDRIWQHISPAAESQSDVLPIAVALLQLPANELELLRSLHLLLAAETARLVDAAPQIARHLRTTTTATLERQSDRVRGPIDWPSTIAASAGEGRRYAFATRPPERDYSTPENRLLVASLRAVVDAGMVLGWEGRHGGISEVIRRRRNDAAAVIASPMLRHLVPPPEASDGRRVLQGRAARRFEPVSRFWRLHERLNRLQDPALLRQMVESTALLAGTDGALLEVLVLLDVLDALRERGWRRARFALIQGQIRVRHIRRNDTLDVHYQGLPGGLAGRYEAVLRSHGLAASALRPDLAFDHRASGRRVVSIVEVKYRRSASDAVRASLLDLLAYRDNYRDAGVPLRLAGIGWGAELSPREGADILLCTPDRIGDLVALLDG